MLCCGERVGVEIQMKNLLKYLIVILLGFIWSTQSMAAESLSRLVTRIQPAVVMITTFDMKNNIAGVGSGFFINDMGHLITNYHVLNGAYSAEVKMRNGERFPVMAVLAEDESSDLIKVSVDTRNRVVDFVNIGDHLPTIAERVVVVGSPLGLDQTVSEGIVSAIREMPGIGTFFQISAPISPGSSGSPVVDMNGDVIGVASFQTVIGQNLNFAVSSKAVLDLADNVKKKTVLEWTYARSVDKPKVAAELCRIGFNYSIKGEDKMALQYYIEATEKDPSDPMTWYGLGYCYAGLDNQAEAIRAYKRAIQSTPDNEMGYFNLASYYDHIGQIDEAIDSYKMVIRMNANFRKAYFNLGMLYRRAGRIDESRHILSELTRIDPDHGPAHFFIGLNSGILGNYDEAIHAHYQVLRIDPTHVPSYYHLGLLYGKVDEPDKEMDAYIQAIRINPDYAPAHYKLGLKYLNDGNRPAALAEYKILMKLDKQAADKLFDQLYE